ncbi:MAG: hypothetical protein HC810_02125 [Acaryochloridaceae cyanobacterium RL_2_7]|nr:hypothetical protein [Acaryochloridaceae cyanobacterium RL_2_7]
MDEVFISDQSEQPIPILLAIALKVAQLSFPELIYSGKVVSENEDMEDCELCLFARDISGNPLPQEAITLEIMKVGDQLSITAEYPEQEATPILWYGQHALWMDGVTGQTVSAPINGVGLERLARGMITRLNDLESC